MQHLGAFYGTNDPETVFLLNQMSEGFKEYGSEGAYNDLPVGATPGTITTLSWDSFINCVATGVAKAYGLDVLKQAFNHEVRQALKSRQWKVASAIIYRNLEKRLGKKAAQWVIKQIAHKFLPGGLPGQIAFQVAKCSVREIW